MSREVVVEARGVTTRFGSRLVHKGIDLTVCRGDTLAIVGGSGSGKSTLMRELAMLLRPASGSIRLFGEEVVGLEQTRATHIRCRFGVLFQEGALFGGLTVLENIGTPLREHAELSSDLIDEIAAVKLGLVGLAKDTAMLYPSELSGGMYKRVALARALAIDPELLFLDEPTTGLDPVTADALDELILKLKSSLGLTIVMVTHDMDTLWRVAERVVLIGDTRVLAQGTMEDLSRASDPRVAGFFQGPRGRAAARARA